MADEDTESKSDETWKKIQQNTFTRWVNQQLKDAEIFVRDLTIDLADGTALIKLAEVLSGKLISRYNRKPQLRTQMLDNVSTVLIFFEEVEGIKIVNIDSMHIVDGNLKLILGLIWTLINHYSICINLSGAKANFLADLKNTPKKRLLAWITSHLSSDIPLTNFKSDWNDGIVLGALLHSLLPDACQDWRLWNPENALENTRKAMRVAEDKLGIAALITAEELLNPNIDEKSVMTYLSQFPNAKEKEKTLKQQIPAGRLRNVDKSPIVGRESAFVIDSLQPSCVKPVVEIFNLHGDHLPVTVTDGGEDGQVIHYEVTFTPKMIGVHKINVFVDKSCDGRGEIEGLVNVANATFNVEPAPDVVGLRPTTELGVEERFRVMNVGESHNLHVVVADTDGQEINLPLLERVGNACTFCYEPVTLGLHSLNVFLDGKHIPRSPFPIHVVSKESAVTLNTIVWGRGVQSQGIRAGDKCFIYVDNCEHLVSISVSYGGTIIPCNSTFDFPSAPAQQSLSSCSNDSTKQKAVQRQSFSYVPLNVGVFKVEVIANGQHIGKSPYDVHVGLPQTLKVRAVGPGIEKSVKNKKSSFYIDTFGGVNSLEFSIEGPSETQISCLDNGDSSAIVDYVPTSSGLYVINVLNNGEHIKDSPFVLMVESDEEDCDIASDFNDDKDTVIIDEGGWSSALSASSDEYQRSSKKIAKPKKENGYSSTLVCLKALEDPSKKWIVGRPVEFFLEQCKQFKSPLSVKVYDPDLSEIKVEKIGEDGYVFVAEKCGKYLVEICKDGVVVGKFPYTVNVTESLNLSKLHVFGAGVESRSVPIHSAASFAVNLRGVGTNNVCCEVFDADGESLPLVVEHCANPDLCKLSYTPEKVGLHHIKVCVDNISAFDANVLVTEDNNNETVMHLSLKSKCASDHQNVVENGSDLEKQMLTSAGALNLADETSKDSVDLDDIQNANNFDTPPAVVSLHLPEAFHHETSTQSPRYHSTLTSSLLRMSLSAIWSDICQPNTPWTVKPTSLSRFADAKNYGSSTATKMCTAEIPNTIVGQSTTLYFKNPRFLDSADDRVTLSGKLFSPDGRGICVPVERASPDSIASGASDEQFCIKFTPSMDGLHSVAVFECNGSEIEGSPFHIYAIMTNQSECDARIYPTAAGSGLAGGMCDRWESFHVFIPAELKAELQSNAEEVAVTIEGPSQVKVELNKIDNVADQLPATATCVRVQVEYLANEPGLFHFDVRHNDVPIVNSPFRVFICPKNFNTQKDDKLNKSTKMETVMPIKLINAPSPPHDLPLSSSLLSSCAPPVKVDYDDNKRRLKMASEEQCPNKKESKMLLTDSPTTHASSLDRVVRRDSESGKGIASQTPSLRRFDGRPHRVKARGEGLKTFRLLHPATFTIDTSNAGSDLLFVSVVTADGPSDNVFVSHLGGGLYEIDYTIEYHHSSSVLIVIKYGNRQIPGSPFIARLITK